MGNKYKYYHAPPAPPRPGSSAEVIREYHKAMAQYEIEVLKIKLDDRDDSIKRNKTLLKIVFTCLVAVSLGFIVLLLSK